MRTGKTEQKIDRMRDASERRINACYNAALRKAFTTQSAALNGMKAIMDGDKQPPRHCVSDEQKAAWKQKQLVSLMYSSGIVDHIAESIAEAGKQAAQEIRRFGVNAYKAAYNGTVEQLHE